MSKKIIKGKKYLINGEEIETFTLEEVKELLAKSIDKQAKLLRKNLRQIWKEKDIYKKIILIGGAPTTGKTTLAKKLSKKLNLPFISTDQIRLIMQSIANKNDFQNLFLGGECQKAEDFLGILSAEQIVEKIFELSEIVGIGIKKFIDNDHVFEKGFIIEGVEITPKFVKEFYGEKVNVLPIFVGDNNIERTRKIIFQRGLFDDPQKYDDEFKEKEIHWVQILNKRIQKEAQENGFKFLELEKNKNDLEKILEFIKNYPKKFLDPNKLKLLEEH